MGHNSDNPTKYNPIIIEWLYRYVPFENRIKLYLTIKWDWMDQQIDIDLYDGVLQCIYSCRINQLLKGNSMMLKIEYKKTNEIINEIIEENIEDYYSMKGLFFVASIKWNKADYCFL